MSSSSATWTLTCCTRVRIGFSLQAVDRRDRHGVVSLVDPQEADLELESADGLVDVVGQPRVQHRLVVAAQLMGLRRGDGDVAQTRCAGDEPAARRHVQRRRVASCAGEDFLGQPVGSGEADQPFHAAQRGLLVGALGHWYPMTPDAGEDGVERVVIVQVPAERGDVLGRAALQQKPALVVVEAEPHRVGRARRRGACRWRRGRIVASRLNLWVSITT